MTTLSFYDVLVLLGIPAFMTGLLQMILHYFSKRYKKDRDDDKKNKEDTVLMKKAMQALLRDKLREHYLKYITKGYISIEDKANFDNMYQIYHVLGENGVMDDMYRKVMRLPTAPKTKRTPAKKLTEFVEEV